MLMRIEKLHGDEFDIASELKITSSQVSPPFPGL
jgi:hypothetical protein